MNEVYYYGQNSCYDSTSIGFDQSQPQQYTVDHPIFNAHNDYLDSQIQLNKRAAKAKYWKLPVCYDDDDDDEEISDSLDDNIFSGLPSSSAITPDEPVLSTEEPDNSLKSETFCFGLEEISSGSTTTHFDICLPEYEAFYDD
nr:hypothetical protein [Tanacetum cinerariifolium]